jgi:hypothetical protein
MLYRQERPSEAFLRREPYQTYMTFKKTVADSYAAAFLF